MAKVAASSPARKWLDLEVALQPSLSGGPKRHGLCWTERRGGGLYVDQQKLRAFDFWIIRKCGKFIALTYPPVKYHNVMEDPHHLKMSMYFQLEKVDFHCHV